jgi:SAM-dependent methyltransferase
MQNQKRLSNFFSSVSEVTNCYYINIFKKYINQNYNILDFGCGDGKFLELIKCKYKAGIEINKFSQQKLKKKKLIYFDKLEKTKKNFNTIFALSVIDHLDNPILFLKKLAKKLKRNGLLIIIIRHDDKNQKSENSSYKNHLYSWSLLSFNNLVNKINLSIIEEGAIKMTLPPKFKFLKKFLGTNIILILSKIYFYFNFKDRRFYFICKKESK